MDRDVVHFASSAASSSAGACSISETGNMSFDVGEDAPVLCSLDDPVALVGARVNVVTRSRRLELCVSCMSVSMRTSDEAGRPQHALSRMV